MNSDKLSYTADNLVSCSEDLYRNGKPDGNRVKKHAMLIVGVRMLEDGTKMFLVQNWWAKKQFVEMDEKYIKACGGRPLFVEKEQTEIPTQFDTIFKMYAETTLDLEEVHPLEY